MEKNHSNQCKYLRAYLELVSVQHRLINQILFFFPFLTCKHSLSNRTNSLIFCKEKKKYSTNSSDNWNDWNNSIFSTYIDIRFSKWKSMYLRYKRKKMKVRQQIVRFFCFVLLLLFFNNWSKTNCILTCKVISLVNL